MTYTIDPKHSSASFNTVFQLRPVPRTPSAFSIRVEVTSSARARSAGVVLTSTSMMPPHHSGCSRPMAPAMELFGLHKTGRLVPIEVTLGPLESEDGMMISGAIRDITVRVAEHRKLRDSEEKLRGLYELSPLGIAMTDQSGRFVEFNEAFRRICGYSDEELKALDYHS